MTVRARAAGGLAVSRKLSRFAPLSSDDLESLERTVCERVDRLGPREDVFREGEKPEHYNVVLSGWACRYKVLEDGRRQIVAILLPGDVCDYGVFMMARLDHSVGTLGPLTCGRITPRRFDELSRDRPLVARALLMDTLATLSMQREWAVNLGQRDAFERMAHLFCELFARLQAVDLTDGHCCECPLTQADLADATGITSVHVNRTLQELRGRKLVAMGNRTLTIPDLPALQAVALFEPEYLHLGEAASSRRRGQGGAALTSWPESAMRP